MNEANYGAPKKNWKIYSVAWMASLNINIEISDDEIYLLCKYCLPNNEFIPTMMMFEASREKNCRLSLILSTK